jgi:cell shape-determining protein MreC
MDDLRRRLATSLIISGIVAAAIVTLVLDRRAVQRGGRDLPAWIGVVLDVAAPVQKAVAVPIEMVRGTFSRYGRLQRIAEMRERYEIPMLPAELVGVDASPWFRSVLVDRGRDRGVRSGMPVISEQGLVGLVTATSIRSAKAMLVLDRQAAIDGVIQRSRARGIVRGEGSDELAFEFVARGNDVQVDDQVITSGLGGVYPKGLLIGSVLSISDPGPGLVQTATIRPAVDFGRLEQVFVMLRRGPAMELLYSTRVGDESPPVGAEEPAS